MRHHRIAVMAAMDKELALILPLLGKNAVKQTAPSDSCVEIWRGTHGSLELALLKSGIGKVNAALATQAVIESFNPDLVISTGVAGGVGAAGVLDVVVADRLTFHDVWCGPGTERGAADGMPRFITPPAELLELDALAENGVVRHGLICSGDIFVSTPQEVAAIKADFPDVQTVEMESGAIAQTCRRHNIDMICIRVVSDTPGAEDNLSQYTDFWSKAPERTFGVVKGLIEALDK